MANGNELNYMIRFTTEGKPEIVEATDDLMQQDAQVLSNRKGMEGLGKSYRNVNEITEQARKNFRQNSAQIKDVASSTNRLSTAERNLEAILEETNVRLAENQYNLENARLEYETGAISQEEYTARLRELKNEVDNIDAPSIQLVRRQRDINRELQKMNPAVQTTTRGFSTANSAIFTTAGALTRLNPMLGSSVTQILSMGRGLGQLTSSSGGVTGAWQTLTRFAMSPAGIVSVLAIAGTGVAALVQKFDLLENSTEDLEAKSKSFIGVINELNKSLSDLNRRESAGLFDTEQLLEEERRLNLMEESAKDLIRQIRENPEGSSISGVFEADVLSQAQRKQLAEWEEYLEGIGGQIDEVRQKREALENVWNLPEVREGEFERVLKEADKNLQELFDDDLDFDLAISADIDELFSEVAESQDLTDALAEQEQAIAENYKAQASARFAFEGNLQQMRINQVRAAGEEIQALEMEKDRALRELDQNRLITDTQREEARMLLIEQYADREVEVNRQKEEKIKQLRENAAQEIEAIDMMVMDGRINNAALAAQAIQSINEGFLGNNQALAVAMFAVERAVAIGQVLMDTKLKAAQATMTGMSLLANPVTAPLAANAFAQAAAITSTGAATAGLMAAMAVGQGASMLAGGGSGSGGSRGSGDGFRYSYRGLPDSGSGNRQRPDDTHRPREIRITDGLGNMVARGQEEIDRGSTSGYVRGGS